MTRRKVLMVEGSDDAHVVKHLFGYHTLPHLDEVKPLGGFSNLIESFPVQLKESDIGTLGVIVDADADIQARWHSIIDRLRQAGYTRLPPSPRPAGSILTAPGNTPLPRVGIWLMPDNRATGILEDFLKFLVPPKSLNDIPPGERRFPPQDEPKALIHTWLAWQEEPGKPYGTAITARYLDAGAPKVETFVKWLKELFDL